MTATMASRRFSPFQMAENGITRHGFVGGAGDKAVGAGQVDQFGGAAVG
jgi:hypothetical protein